ncbi:MAG: hypothetical protein JWR57_1050 [Mycetocola sp.]|jgi:hypothetical protein|nr:hypothetical protein [Mycetocola sp.]
MSITDVKSEYDVRASAEYLVFGVGAKKKQHKAAGTNRITPGFYCDAPSVAEFVAMGERLAKRNSRRVQAQSYVLSFSPEEFDVDSPADLQRVGDAGFLLAKKMHPHSPCLIVVHADGKGRAAHAHIKVLNHNAATGKAVRDYRVHWQVKKANDELMRELDMQVLEAKPKQPTDAWASRRSGLSEFEQQLGDICAEARVEALAETLEAPSPSMGKFIPRFAAACRARGTELVVDEYEVSSGNRGGKQVGDAAVGFTFRMRDDTTPKHRIRRRKASALSSEFTHDAIAAAFDSEQAERPLTVTPVEVPAPRRSRRTHAAQQRTAAKSSGRVTHAQPDPEQLAPVVAATPSWKGLVQESLEVQRAGELSSPEIQIGGPLEVPFRLSEIRRHPRGAQ